MCSLCYSTPCLKMCPNNNGEIVGSCHYCGEILLDIHEIWEDFEGNLYCDQECAIKHYGIREKL